MLSKMSRALKPTSIATGLIAAIMIVPAHAQQKLTKDQLVGTWTIASIVNIVANGDKFDPMEGKGTGVLIFDAAGHFSWQIIRSDTPKFASNNRLQGTPDEYKGSSVGTLSYFGTYALDDSGKALTLHIDQSSFGNFRGADQKRDVTFAGDELTLSNAAGAAGGTANVTWRKAK